ncbi:MAG TPA: 2-dehydropantoate 2-reductase [bacterium]|nr:2-dehydropantoate 2-reductase [bacterium]
MNFTVVGAGAIGGTVGAHLVRAGHDVLFVDTVAEHVEAIRRDGLAIEGRAPFTVRARAVTAAGLAGAVGGRRLDAVLLAVKAMHTAAALEPLVPLLGPDSFVVSLQNGLNEKVIAARVGAARTVGAFVNFGADYQSPGRILYGGGGALYLGELDGRITPRLEQLGGIFRAAFLENTTLTANIWGYLWGKLGYGSMLFATAVVDETIADVLADAASRPLLANLAGEVVRVADAEGVRSEGFDGYDPDAMRFAQPRNWAAIHQSLDRLAAFNRASLKQKSGVWRDLAVRHRRTEVDDQIAVIVRAAEERGCPAPLNRRLVEIIHDLEAGRRPMSAANLDDLRRLNEQEYSESLPGRPSLAEQRPRIR